MRTLILTVLLLSAGTFACGTNPLPRSITVTQEQAVTSGKGAYARVTYQNLAQVAGELIAVSADTVWILTDAGTLTAARAVDVKSVLLGVYSNHKTEYGGWTALGAFSTISHGGFLILSLPVWLATGIPSTVHESRRGVFESTVLADLRPYARFPQGLPAGFNRPPVVAVRDHE